MYSYTHVFNVFFINMLCKLARKNNRSDRKMGTGQKPNGIIVGFNVLFSSIIKEV